MRPGVLLAQKQGEGLASSESTRVTPGSRSGPGLWASGRPGSHGRLLRAGAQLSGGSRCPKTSPCPLAGDLGGQNQSLQNFKTKVRSLCCHRQARRRMWADPSADPRSQLPGDKTWPSCRRFCFSRWSATIKTKRPMIKMLESSLLELKMISFERNGEIPKAPIR